MTTQQKRTMTMKHNIHHILYAGCAAMALTACTDSFLDKNPDERIEITSQEDVILLLTQSYPSANIGWVCELTSDNIMDMNSKHLPISSTAEQKETHYNLTSYGRQDDEMFRFEPVRSSTGSDTPAGIWEDFYTSICSVNEALRAIARICPDTAQMSKELKAAYAEAKLIRAYDHFVLVNVFSQAYKDDNQSRQDIGVPYVTEPETKVDLSFDRSNVTDTYAKIEADLLDGLRYVNDVNYKMLKWHFTVDAANAFAARFYLFKRNWQKVKEHTSKVLAATPELILADAFPYVLFDGASYSDDFANGWQTPYYRQNIMLMDTYSVIFRHARAGYRYEQGSTVARDIYYHNAPMWSRWTANPSIIASGLFGSRDYGFLPGWVCEQFQYSDKVAGIGYAHTVRREFTMNELLLMRAEANTMLGDSAEAVQDLCTYHACICNFSEADKLTYNMKIMTGDNIRGWFGNASNPNCFADWDFVTAHVSPTYVIDQNKVALMNCINYWRRYELNFTGMRFFDLKRWGMEWEHVYGPNNEVYRMTWDDPRRAIEVPEEAIAVGLQPSRPTAAADSTRLTRAVNYLVQQ